MPVSPKNFTSLRNKLGVSQEGLGKLLGVTGKYVGMIERGEKAVDEASPLGLLFALIEAQPSPEPVQATSPVPTPLKEDEPPYRTKPQTTRMIGVAGWAHAGAATSYEELPESWQDKVPTECRDPKAFAVRLEGESMEPRFSEGDLLVLQPSLEAYNGCLAVCRFNNDGIVFRRVEFMPDKVRLIALNPVYQPSEHSREDFTWIYPVWGRWTQIWK